MSNKNSIFRGYKEPVKLTVEVLALGDLSSRTAINELEMFLHDKKISRHTREARKYMKILQVLGYDVKRRRDEYFFNGQKVVFYESV